MARSATNTDETIDIENSGNAVELTLGGRTTVSLVIEGDATATYQLDIRRTGGSWKTNIVEYSGSSDYDDAFETGAQEVRVRCSSGSGGGGDQADILLMASG